MTIVDNTGDAGNESLALAVQSDGRVQFTAITGSNSRTVQFSESGIISEIKSGSVLWTTQNAVKIKTISSTISANAQSAYTTNISFTPDDGYVAIAVAGYNITWNHCEVYGLFVENNKLYLSLQNTGTVAMSNVNATFYIVEVRWNFA